MIVEQHEYEQTHHESRQDQARARVVQVWQVMIVRETFLCRGTVTSGYSSGPGIVIEG